MHDVTGCEDDFVCGCKMNNKINDVLLCPVE